MIPPFRPLATGVAAAPATASAAALAGNAAHGVIAHKSLAGDAPDATVQALAAKLHGAQFAVKDRPGFLFDVRCDDKGNLDCERFMVRIVNGRAQVIETPKPAWTPK